MPQIGLRGDAPKSFAFLNLILTKKASKLFNYKVVTKVGHTSEFLLGI